MIYDSEGKRYFKKWVKGHAPCKNRVKGENPWVKGHAPWQGTATLVAGKSACAPWQECLRTKALELKSRHP